MVEVTDRADLIERKIDRSIADEILVNKDTGVDINKLSQVMEIAKLMSISDSMVPAFLREKPGSCFSIVWKALAWGLDPFGVASQAYEVENKRTRERTVAYMSSLTNAVIIRRAPIKEHGLRVRYEGEGDDKVCIVWATFVSEDEPREWRSPRLGDRRPAKRQSSNGEDWAPGSPLWYSKPEMQLFYDTSRDWIRIYCPDVLLGIYTREEMEAVGFTGTAPVARETPPDDGGFSQRLSESALARVGFLGDKVMAAADEAVAKRGWGEPAPVQEAVAEAQTGEAEPVAPEAPESEEGRPRASRSRRTPRPAEQNVGNPQMGDAITDSNGNVIGVL